MELLRREIADGIFADCLATNKFKVNSMTVGFELPLELKTVTEANLLTRVLNRGCEKYPDIAALERKLDELYATELSLAVNRFGESQYLCLYADFLSSRYTEGCDIIKETIDMIGEVLLHPLCENGAFRESYIKSEKKNLCDDIDAIINNKAKYARNRCIEEMCRGEAYSLPMNGDKAVLDKITGSELLAFHRDMLKHSRIEFLYTGDKAYFDDICSHLKRIFSELERDYRPIAPECDTGHEPKSMREIKEDMEVNQGKLAIGIRTGIKNGDAELAPLIVMAEMFGGSPNSKLFMNVREKMSLCYYCSSSLDAAKGLMFINAGIESQNYEVARDAIFAQLTAMQNGDFTEEEFSCALSSLINAYNSVADSVSSLESWYLPRVFKDETDTPEARINDIMKVTREDCIRVARKLSADVVYFLNGTLSEA